MAMGEACNDVPRCEDYGTAKMADEAWWFTQSDAFRVYMSLREEKPEPDRATIPIP